MNEITQAFVLAAGVGKRLRPLTEDLPKPLIPIFQKPLITFALDHLINVGVERFIVNTHKRAEVFENFFRDNKYEDHSLKLIHEPDLLERWLCAITALWISRTATVPPGFLISRTSLFGIRRFSSESRRNKKFRSFQLLRIG